MSDGAIGKISNMLQGMKPGKIAKIQSINTGRAGTVTAGACVIDMLMRNLEFGRIALSAHALREGTLGVSLAFAKSYSGGRIITEEQIGRAVRAASAPDPLPDYLGTLLGMLEEDGRLEESGSRILAHALARLPPTSSFRDLSGMLRMTMDADSHLSHREQMISSLSVITYRKKRAAGQASSGFEALLRPRDRKTVKRISSLLALKEVLDTAGAGVSVQRVPGGMSFEIRTAGALQEILLKGAIKRVSASLGISVGYRISDQAP
jgi:exopolyphosphatase/pppGpp-phosphohydrolase